MNQEWKGIGANGAYGRERLTPIPAANAWWPGRAPVDSHFVFYMCMRIVDVNNGKLIKPEREWVSSIGGQSGTPEGYGKSRGDYQTGGKQQHKALRNLFSHDFCAFAPVKPL